jgi:hypothetical protein
LLAEPTVKRNAAFIVYQPTMGAASAIYVINTKKLETGLTAAGAFSSVMVYYFFFVLSP